MDNSGTFSGEPQDYDKKEENIDGLFQSKYTPETAEWGYPKFLECSASIMLMTHSSTSPLHLQVRQWVCWTDVLPW